MNEQTDNSQTLTPEEFVQEVARALPVSTPAEAHRLVEHAKAWATVFYDGKIPKVLAAGLAHLEEECPA